MKAVQFFCIACMFYNIPFPSFPSICCLRLILLDSISTLMHEEQIRTKQGHGRLPQAQGRWPLTWPQQGLKPGPRAEMPTTRRYFGPLSLSDGLIDSYLLPSPYCIGSRPNKINSQTDIPSSYKSKVGNSICTQVLLDPMQLWQSMHLRELLPPIWTLAMVDLAPDAFPPPTPTA